MPVAADRSARLLPHLALLLCLCFPLAAAAETWRVDLLVFRYLRDVDERGIPPAAVNTRGAIELTDAQSLSRAGITLLPEAEFALEDQWRALRASPQFRPLIRLSWTQNDPPARGGPRLRIQGGEKLVVADPSGFGARELNEIDGSVGLNLGRYLHLDTDLMYSAPGAEPLSWALSEPRRMRSEELHHLDSPRLAILARVVRWTAPP